MESDQIKQLARQNFDLDFFLDNCSDKVLLKFLIKKERVKHNRDVSLFYKFAETKYGKSKDALIKIVRRKI